MRRRLLTAIPFLMLWVAPAVRADESPYPQLATNMEIAGHGGFATVNLEVEMSPHAAFEVGCSLLPPGGIIPVQVSFLSGERQGFHLGAGMAIINFGDEAGALSTLSWGWQKPLDESSYIRVSFTHFGLLNNGDERELARYAWPGIAFGARF